ncbi:MAG: hypothetical protein ACI9X4_000259 [Glaciecola sp.]|jgi:hypothetical protein
MKLSRLDGATIQKKGVVTTTCISVVSVIAVLVISLLGRQSERGQMLEDHEHEVVADEIGESVIGLAMAKILEGQGAGEVFGNPELLKSRLDSLGVLSPAQDGDRTATDFRGNLGIKQDADGAYPFGGGFVLRLDVERRDSEEACEFVIEALASMGEGTPERRLRRAYDSAGRSKEE